MNNQTIDGVLVSRELLKVALGNPRNGDEMLAKIKAKEELRALLDAPAKAEFSIPDCPDCACVQDGQCLCIPSKPAAQPQGEPVAWIKPDVAKTLRKDECCYAFGSQNPKGTLIPLYAEPPAPERPSHANPPPGTEPSGTHHDNDGLDEWRKPVCCGSCPGGCVIQSANK